jgi:hypothetical protein
MEIRLQANNDGFSEIFGVAIEAHIVHHDCG